MKLADYQQGLGKTGIKLFEDWRKKYGLSEEKEMLLLGIVAECWEAIVDSREKIKEEGTTVMGSHGIRAHPAIDVGKKAKDQVLAAIKILGLENYQGDEVLKDFNGCN
jgi:phage terminase small subunit